MSHFLRRRPCRLLCTSQAVSSDPCSFDQWSTHVRARQSGRWPLQEAESFTCSVATDGSPHTARIYNHPSHDHSRKELIAFAFASPLGLPTSHLLLSFVYPLTIPSVAPGPPPHHVNACSLLTHPVYQDCPPHI
jgi:hypothetical protein